MSIKIKFCGGLRTVTGSMHLIKTPRGQILLDSGLFQGRREDFYRINTSFPFPISEVNGLVLSHAHIDHSGNIPTLVKNGFKSPIYTTHPTVDLCGLMLPDSGHIQEEDIKFVNKINRRKGLPLRQPLYTENDAYQALSSFRGVNYHQPITLTDDMTVTFYDAGHVLGSAISVLDIQNDGNGATGKIRLVYAVDLGRNDLPLLKNPEFVNDIDYLIIEGTYGNRQHEPVQTAKGKLTEVVNRTIKRGGKIIIPSFAFERTQEVVYFLNELVREKKIPKVPIIVDSPLATNITAVFQRNIHYLDEKTRNLMSKNMDPFGFNLVQYIRSREESQRLNNDRRPMIIISASGMCEAGRILHHLKNNIENPANTILVVGYMAQNTLGKKIVERQPVVKIFGEEYELRAEVVKINAFSA
ncbi:MAG: MBL fold metallo-hydrolase, partial [Planctomycetota bacterium]